MKKHLHNSLRALFLSLAVLLSLPLMAAEVEIDGIRYDLNAEAKQATVIAMGRYSGEVVIPESVEFRGISHSVTSIGNNAFNRRYDLTSVTIPNSVTSIGRYAFYYCSGLTSVTIPDRVTSIGESAFANCSGLTSVTIGNSVESIGQEAFYECSGLTSVHISDIAAWCNIDFSNYASNPLYYVHHLYLNGEEVKDLVITNSVTSIGDYAFYYCSGLTSVTIPNSVTSIGERAFYYCSGLTSVTIGNSVESIGQEAFYYCSGLTSVTIGNSVTSIGRRAFAYCTELLDVYCYAEKVPNTESNAFDGSYPEYVTLHVPDASIDSYKATAPWSVFVNIVGLSGEEPEQPEVEKCATPVVTYAEGKLSFSCETTGAQFVTDITDTDIKKHYDAEIELSATYNIEVFATKANCENSDTVSVALVWIENGDVSEDTGVISVESTPVLITCCNGTINVCGGEDGTKVAVYTTSGVAVGDTTIINGNAVINTSLTKGDIAIVNIAGKGIKVVMQ